MLRSFSNVFFQLRQYLRVVIIIIEGYILWGLGAVGCFLKKNTSGVLLCLISFFAFSGSHFKSGFFFFQRGGKEIIFHDVKAEVLTQSFFYSYWEFRQSVDHA